jgi:two-component system chemotaxis response regulator CheY
MSEPPSLLIVDDSTAIRKILIRILGQAGIALGPVHEAGDGSEALKVLEGNAVSMVLSDINMPNMDGIELLRSLRASERWKELPVVLITTEGAQARVQEAVELGATSYIRKPFNADQLRDRLTTLLAR